MIRAELRIKEDLRANLPPATKYDLQVVQTVRVYQEGIKRWEGYFMIDKICDKNVWVTDGVNRRQFNCEQALPNPKDVAGGEITRLRHGFRTFSTGGLPGVYVTDVLHPDCARNKYIVFEMLKAK